MLREDKNAWIERVELITEAETAARNRAGSAEWRVGHLARQISQDEETVKQCEEGLEEASAQRSVGLLGFTDRLLSRKARQMERDAHGAHWAVVTRLNEENRYAQQRLHANREALSAADAECRRCKGTRGRRGDTNLGASASREGSTSSTSPTTSTRATSRPRRRRPSSSRPGKRGIWWWFAGRFWWDSEGLSADDVQALVLQRDKKKQATLERARADAFGSAATDAPEVVRRPSIPESVRHEVWRRDQGRCVDCGSRENLEFDHIIPFSKGGSNTARNLELRCEQCNRRKAATI